MYSPPQYVNSFQITYVTIGELSATLVIPMPTNQIVYVVDDGADYRFLLQQVFLRYLPQLDVLFFESGDLLCQHSQTGNVAAMPGLILLDLNMPGLNGLQTLKLLKQQPNWCMVPVVVMSSVDSPTEVEQCYDAGANSFLAKPIEFEKLKNVIVETCQYWLTMNQQVYRQDLPPDIVSQ